MSDAILERLRMVEKDWRELHKQNEQLIELHRSLLATVKRLREALQALVTAMEQRPDGAEDGPAMAAARAALAPDAAKEGT